MLSAKQTLVSYFSCILVMTLASATTRAVDDDLAGAIESVRTGYQPVTAEQSAEKQDELAAAAQQLEQTLIPGSDRGERWKSYLQWEGVQQSLATPDKPNLPALANTLDRLKSGAAGTEQPAFRRVRKAIEAYLDLAVMQRVSDQQKAVDQQLQVLAKYLDRYAQEPSARARYEIERRLDLFSGIGRGSELTSLLRNRFNQPNIQAELSEEMLNKLIADPVDDVAPVTDCILGTSIRGTGHTYGSVSIDLLENYKRASVELRLQGTTHSETRGYNGPVVIRSSGTTPFTATKRIELEDSDFWVYPTRASATTSTVTRSVKKQGGGLGSGIIERIGERQVAEKKPRANYIAARHAEQRIADNLNEELMPKLQDARYEYENEFKKPLADRGAEPRYVSFYSTDDSLCCDLLQAGRGELGADSAPDPLSGSYDMTVKVHETGVSNLLSVYLGGATLSQKTKAGHPKLNVTLPNSIRQAIDKAREESESESAEEDDREFKPWSLVFRRQRPVSVEFVDNMVKLRLHAARITAGDSQYDGWDILVNYGLHVQNGGLTLVRDGDIDVLPTAFDPADGGGLSGRQVGLRGNLAKELNRQAESGRGFREVIEIPMLDLPGDLQEHGPLMLEEATSGGNWLSLGWNLP